MEMGQEALAARIRAEDIQMQVELDKLRNPLPSPSLESAFKPEEGEEGNEEKCNVMDVDIDAAEDAWDNEPMPAFMEETCGEVLDTTADFDTELTKYIKPEPGSEPDSSMLYEDSDTHYRKKPPEPSCLFLIPKR